MREYPELDIMMYIRYTPLCNQSRFKTVRVLPTLDKLPYTLKLTDVRGITLIWFRYWGLGLIYIVYFLKYSRRKMFAVEHNLQPSRKSIVAKRKEKDEQSHSYTGSKKTHHVQVALNSTRPKFSLAQKISRA